MKFKRIIPILKWVYTIFNLHLNKKNYAAVTVQLFDLDNKLIGQAKIVEKRMSK